MDSISRKKRSEIMRAIKSKDSKIELILRKELSKAGYKFRTNVLGLEGKPDIVFAKKKLVIFLDSCFWHGCKKHYRTPKTNHAYWQKKIKNNKKRDGGVNKIYKKMGWKILRFWEHQLLKSPYKIVSKIGKFLQGN